MTKEYKKTCICGKQIQKNNKSGFCGFCYMRKKQGKCVKCGKQSIFSKAMCEFCSGEKYQKAKQELSRMQKQVKHYKITGELLLDKEELDAFSKRWSN